MAVSFILTLKGEIRYILSSIVSTVFKWDYIVYSWFMVNPATEIVSELGCVYIRVKKRRAPRR